MDFYSGCLFEEEFQLLRVSGTTSTTTDGYCEAERKEDGKYDG